ncbi:MAG: hypothetical protein KatS3mg072_2634 [Meiothermus sp.]|nr:MAG: hypothetical protein KatS3mg072_2634 [Meiothermus sp.]
MRTVEIQYRAKGVIDDVSLGESYIDVVGIRAWVNALTNLYELASSHDQAYNLKLEGIALSRWVCRITWPPRFEA